jgi:hypothetical protein
MNLGDEAARVAGAHAARAARDNHRLIIETFHDCFLSCITPRTHLRPLIEVSPSNGVHFKARAMLTSRESG